MIYRKKLISLDLLLKSISDTATFINDSLSHAETILNAIQHSDADIVSGVIVSLLLALQVLAGTMLRVSMETEETHRALGFTIGVAKYDGSKQEVEFGMPSALVVIGNSTANIPPEVYGFGCFTLVGRFMKQIICYVTCTCCKKKFFC